MTGFVIRGISAEPWRDLYGSSDTALAARGAVRMIADGKPGYPCRVTLTDAEVGETLLLVNYEHQPEATPYRSCHAIFVREGAGAPAAFVDEVPESLAVRLLSVRAFDAAAMMIDADCCEGSALAQLIGAMFANAAIAYLHVHNAKRGCFAARVDRSSQASRNMFGGETI